MVGSCAVDPGSIPGSSQLRQLLRFSSDSESEDAQQSTKLSKSRFSQRQRNREATIAHVRGRYTIEIIFARLSTKSFVELRGPLWQPEVRALQVTVLIHAAQSCSSHAYYYITPTLSTGSRSSFKLHFAQVGFTG